MKLHEIAPAPNSTKSQKRLGRGIGSGLGKTSGKGHKGQNARSGGGVRLGFEGGQMPLIRKLPRRGFNNANFKKQYSIVNLAVLNKFEENAVVLKQLIEKFGDNIETEKIESAINKSKMYSYNSLNESLANDGFKFKPYSITTSEDDTEHFVKINKVRFIYGAIMSVLMLLQIATIYIILKSSNNLISNDSTLYIVAMLAPITTFIAYLIPYISKKDERKSKYYNLNYHLMFGILYMFCGLILTYAINLIVGLNHTNTLS